MDHGRRAVLTGLAASLLGPPAQARVGLVGRRELVDMLGELEAVEEGAGGLVQVIISPDCGHSLAIFDAAAELLGQCRWRWIPFSGQTAEGRSSVARVLANRDRATLQGELVERSLKGSLPRQIDSHLDAIIRKQDDILDLKIGRWLWEATFRAFSTPTAVFTDKAGLTRVVRGDPRPDDIAWMAGAAS